MQLLCHQSKVLIQFDFTSEHVGADLRILNGIGRKIATAESRFSFALRRPLFYSSTDLRTVAGSTSSLKWITSLGWAMGTCRPVSIRHPLHRTAP